jgi:sigma-E factor negative regulatory protein RseA
MSQIHREQLSLLMDGGLDTAARAEVVHRLSGDPELRAVWNRYHLMGDALRGEPLTREILCIADRVRDALADEPVVLVPRWQRLPRSWMVPIAGVALAASVAGLALVVGPGLLGGDTALAPAGQGSLAQEQDKPPTVLYLDRAGTNWNLKRPEMESKLNSYLVNHQEYAPASGMKGMLPYATLASYDMQR